MSAEPRRTPGLDEVAALARGLKPIARFIAAGILGFAMYSAWDLATGWLVTAGILLGLPGLLYAWLWWLLYALGELPERLHEGIGTFKGIRGRPPATTALRKLGRGLKDVWNVMDAADNVWLPISATILLMNPFGWIVLAGGLAYALVLWLSAAVTGLVSVLS
jgi:hypothetical protein